MLSFLYSLFQGLFILPFHLLTLNYFIQPQPTPTTPSKMKNIVIIGGSYAGLSTAHQILKQTSKSASSPAKITLISRDTHLYWNLAAPRAVASAEEVPDEKLFVPIAEGFRQYPKGRFEFVLGTATGVDVGSKEVYVSVAGDGESGEKKIEISYDLLVLCTGSDTKVATPFKSRGSTEATKTALHEYQRLVRAAKSILVVGAGPTGVETAGELASEFGSQKKIILASATPTILPGPNRPPSVPKTAESQLRALNVDVRLNTKVTTETKLADGTWKITLSNGEELVVDMYIPTFGVKPNTSFLPAEFLDADGFVRVDQYLRVTGTKDLYAIGDVSNMQAPQAFHVKAQTKYLAKSIVLGVTGKGGAVGAYKASASDVLAVQIGKKAGTGHLGSMKLPSFMVAYVRRTLFVEDAPKTVDGSA
ncbi:putative apoptosis-inducing factor [Aspergillus pseudodeflectus]|uniref:Apoptosis-inducing factor n=1 Tax=Aspergillus pseudodeflectus TaxID=176178 RepID=A0ABR4LBB3_9EURO